MTISKKLILGIFLLGAAFSLKPLFSLREPDVFRLEKVASCKEIFPSYGLDGEILLILSQPFTYLGHGEEAVAFLSEDKRFVLKLFLQESLRGEKRFSFPNLKDWVLGSRGKKLQRRLDVRRKALLQTLSRYVTIYERMREEAGLIALHFGPTDKGLPVATLIYQGKKFSCPLDTAYFTLQHKATLVPEKLEAAKDAQEKKYLLQQIENFFVQRAQRGFTDIRGKCTLETNFGFLDDRLIQFDVGGVVFSEEIKSCPEKEIDRMKSFFSNWLKVAENS